MKKILFALAACALSTAALAQPAPSSRAPVVVDRADVMSVQMDRRDRMDRMDRMDRRDRMEHRRHKRWIPAHRERGHYVPGHYVWR